MCSAHASASAPRTHVDRIVRKTGTGRQSRLVAVLEDEQLTTPRDETTASKVLAR